MGMDEDKRLRQLKERADQTIFREVSFTAELEQGVRNRLRKRSRAPLMRFGTAGVAVCLLFFALWQVWPLAGNQGLEGNGSTSANPPSLLPGGTVETPVLWQPSPVVQSTYDNQPFSYIGEKPVRVITEVASIYEGQQQKFFWLLDGDFAPEVQVVAYSSEGLRVELGTYGVMEAQYDAKGHFPSGLVLPEPGIWKLQILSGGKHFGHVFVEVKAGVAPGNQTLVEPLIRSYLEVEGTKMKGIGTDRKITIDLLHVEAPSGDKRRAYAWVEVKGVINGISTGLNAPMAFDIQFDGNAYQVVDFQMPEDGNRYRSSLERIFPPKVLEKLDQRQTSP
jgi:hypothetical protein